MRTMLDFVTGPRSGCRQFFQVMIFFVTWGAFYLANSGGLRRMKYVFPVKLIGNIYGKVLEELNIETRRPCSACYLRTSSVARNSDIFRFSMEAPGSSEEDAFQEPLGMC